MDLFDHSLQEQLSAEAPLAARMRPRTLDEIVGQEHILGPGTLLRRAIEADRLFSSIIFYGPPGTGKTTIARVIANQTQAEFVSLSAVLAGVSSALSNCGAVSVLILRSEGIAASRIAPTIKPIATERKSFTNMMAASLIKGTAAAYHEFTGHHTRG